MLHIPKLFNEHGSDDFESQAIIGGNPTGVANLNKVRYGWATSTYKRMLDNFWRPEKINLTEDKLNIKSLTPEEAEATKDTLSGLIFLDNFQVNNLPNIAQYITCDAVKHVLVVQEFQEVIHSQTYQYMLESLYNSFERDEIYNRWRNNAALKKRCQSIADIAQRFTANPCEETFDDVLLANLNLEGIYFYQGFNYFDHLRHRKKLVNCGSEIDYIRVDEKIHVGIFINLLRERWVSKQKIMDSIDFGVRNEIEWCTETYGNRILGKSTRSDTQYCKWLGNQLAEKCGCPPIYENVDNPYQFLDNSNATGGQRKNFFESGGVVEYDTAESVEGWDEL